MVYWLVENNVQQQHHVSKNRNAGCPRQEGAQGAWISSSQKLYQGTCVNQTEGGGSCSPIVPIWFDKAPSFPYSSHQPTADKY